MGLVLMSTKALEGGADFTLVWGRAGQRLLCDQADVLRGSSS
jgi:hypothetical protein